MRILISFLVALLLAACSPTYNWRAYQSTHAPYSVVFPDKPDAQTRQVNLGGVNVEMTMTGARVEGNVFAVGSAQVASEAQAAAALAAMKTAMVQNIGGTVTSEKATANALDIVANGSQKGHPIRLYGHFEARQRRIYQVIVIGDPQHLSDENVEMFLSSFKLN